MKERTRASAAVSEIVRVAWWSLRALGCPLGAVEAMARVLVYSEVLDGQTLAALRRHERALIAAFAEDPPRFDPTGDAGGTIDASRRSMLDIGPRAIDLVTGLAKRNGGVVRVTITRAADMIGLAGAATVAARRNIGLVLIGGDTPRAWQFYAATRDGEIASVAGEWNGSVDDVTATLRKLAGTSFPAITPSIDARDGGEVLLQLIAFPFVAASDFGADLSRREGVVCKNVTRALNHAYAHGVDVALDDLRFLYELETRTWAPSSERSRMQAGFQVAAPAA